MARRRTIGESPLDLLLAGPVKPSRPAPAARPVAEGRSVRATFHLPAAVVEEAKDAVVALSGPPMRLTLARLVREALVRELARLKKAHHGGKPWPKRKDSGGPHRGGLLGGRPVSS